jgi:membrane-anchored protein YejM (alkaline phosphatase superfamily)
MDTIVGQREIDEAKADNWGVPDEYIFDKAHEMFSEARDRPFFGLVLTVSNHEPYNVPEGRTWFEPPKTLEAKIRNAYRYADWALEDFFRKAEKEDYYRRTIFLLVADHGVRLDHRPSLDAPGYRIPCVIYAPGLAEADPGKTPRITWPRTVETICSQVDVAPTIMALLGGSYEHCFLGRDIMSVSPGDGFAFIHEDDRLGLIRGDRVLVVPPLCDPVLYERTSGRFDRIRSRDTDPDDVHSLKLKLLSYYGTARDLYLTSSYRSPVDAHTGGPQIVRRARSQPAPGEQRPR